MRLGWRGAAGALVVLVIVLVVAEIVAARVLPSTGVVPPDLFIADATRGLALRPGFNGTITRAGHSFDVHIDAAGYRNDAPPPERSQRILVIGSSAGFGVGLSREASLVGQLARDLAPDFSVINAAVYTYGPVQSLETLRLECPKTRPALVLYLHEYKDTRTDFLRLRYISGDVEVDVPNRPTVSLLLLRSLLSDKRVNPRQIIERLIGIDRLPISYRNRYATTIGSDFPPENAKRTAELIGEMAALARQCGADFRVAVLPAPNEAYYGITEPATETLLTALRAAGNGEPVIDARTGIKLGSEFFLSAIDYPNAVGATYLGARIAAQIPR
ncbi:MAG: hydrolase-like protein acetyltransferase AlgX [Rhodospirillales bacterium]|nr:hydrolase-like protein acetyltransferase AlgX [Rhodospirillales bacterium]